MYGLGIDFGAADVTGLVCVCNGVYRICHLGGPDCDVELYASS